MEHQPRPVGPETQLKENRINEQSRKLRRNNLGDGKLSFSFQLAWSGCALAGNEGQRSQPDRAGI